MKIRLISDAHFEFYQDKNLYQNPDNADVLVIAGDLAGGHVACWTALKQFAGTHEHVLYVSGNHEYYNTFVTEFDDYIRRVSECTRVHFLNPGMIKIKDVTFIGGNLWTNFQQDIWAKQVAARNIADFRYIKEFSTDKAAELHYKHIKFIKEAYATAEGKKVIISHFLPAVECVAKQFLTEDNAAINKYFANNYGGWISELTDVPYWFHGHTHDNVDITLGDTRVIANPYGYNENFNYKEMVVEV